MTQVASDQDAGSEVPGVLWYALDGVEVASTLGVDPAVGHSAERAAALLGAHGPNVLPQEKASPGSLRFVDQYRTYMRLILIGAAIVSAVFGFALGFDLETPGLMDRVPKPRGESVLTPRMMVTVGAAGLMITVGLPTMIELGTKHFHSEAVGNSIAFTTFALCLVVAALECQSETGTILATATFDSKQMNRALIIEVILAVLITQMDALCRLLDTTDLNVREFGWALASAIGLFIVWELGKFFARRYIESPAPTSDAIPVEALP